MSTATYVVRQGESLDLIARVFGTTVEAIMNANELSNPNVLSVGQTLRIPLPTVSAPFVAAPYWPGCPGYFGTFGPAEPRVEPAGFMTAGPCEEAHDKGNEGCEDRKCRDKHRDKHHDRRHDRHERGDDGDGYGSQQSGHQDYERRRDECAGKRRDRREYDPADSELLELPPLPAFSAEATGEIPAARVELPPAFGVVPRLPQIDDVLVVGIPFRHTSIRIADGLLFVLNADKSEYRVGETVTMRLMKFNIGPVPLILRYRSSQLSEFLVSRDGIEVFRASAGRVFTPALQEIVLSPGAAQSFTETFIPSAPGVHRITAWNLAIPRLRMSLDIRVEAVGMA